MPGLKAALFGIGSAVVTAIVASIAAECPGLVANVPQIILAGVLAGIGKYMHSERSQA